jgi:hypothetical protein
LGVAVLELGLGWGSLTAGDSEDDGKGGEASGE